MADNLVELEILALSNSAQQTHSYAILLGEVRGARKIPIIIGTFEAQAIAIVLERVQPSRPMSHDLMRNIMTAFGVTLQYIVIHKLEEGVFYSKLICDGGDGVVEIDSRTSDALALAVRFKCKIFATEETVNKAGTYSTSLGNESIDESIEELLQSVDPSSLEEDKSRSKQSEYSHLSISQLKDKLQEVLETEDYVAAAKIRDEIARRSASK
ncbi:MAG: hypothetical protein RL660_25 [Bacteroidota bacterium]|jgi:bifunctional DNase/RNase